MERPHRPNVANSLRIDHKRWQQYLATSSSTTSAIAAYPRTSHLFDLRGDLIQCASKAGTRQHEAARVETNMNFHYV
jgi:hypothetical protein